MTIESWSLLFFTCLLGAMSPGPSLLCILQITIQRSRRAGVVAALSHGIGVGVWAACTVYGLGALFVASPSVIHLISATGGAYLIYLGVKAISSSLRAPQPGAERGGEIDMSSPLVSGFAIAFLNPKLAVFFTALFSQFLSNNLTSTDQWLMVLLAGGIDAVWYVIVAILASLEVAQRALYSKLRRIDLISGLLFIVIGANVLFLALRETF